MASPMASTHMWRGCRQGRANKGGSGRRRSPLAVARLVSATFGKKQSASRLLLMAGARDTSTAKLTWQPVTCDSSSRTTPNKSYLTPAAVRLSASTTCRSLRYSWHSSEEDEHEDGNPLEPGDTSAGGANFDAGVELFNAGEYYRCHDVWEALWYDAGEPKRSVLHGLLQFAVGLHHLLHQNHRGALLEFGEGLHKLRRLRLTDGPLHEFEVAASKVQDFVYDTQLEHAACSEDYCVPMSGDEASYRLLGDFAAGQSLYKLQPGLDGSQNIVFWTGRQQELASQGMKLTQVRVPSLTLTEDELLRL